MTYEYIPLYSSLLKFVVVEGGWPMILMVMIMKMMIVQKHKQAKTILIYCVRLFIAALL